MGTTCSKPKPQYQRVAICASLLACHRLTCEQHRSFLSCIVTGDKKWCLYANVRKGKEWLSPNKRRTASRHACTCLYRTIIQPFHFVVKFYFLHNSHTVRMQFFYVAARCNLLLGTAIPCDKDFFGEANDPSSTPRIVVSGRFGLAPPWTSNKVLVVSKLFSEY